ncbi:MAG: Uma2 family endonuclease [Oscillatoriophycideae cyanobacterium NC_groundwater_1537_Pr4_S-0.65um_50_18]|nr:Uma2 family endonuclease [Oscillatoriophycideae cyanobacterium NC_groundwater_1537_Pr4_S-0.65um_50_18]
MVASSQPFPLTCEEYLHLEENSPVKHEYRDGQVYAMVGHPISMSPSPSTEAFDRGDKFADYQTLESLQEYVLINAKRQRVECFRRSEAGLWVLQSYTPSQTTFRLDSLSFERAIAELYEDVVFEPSIAKEVSQTSED